MGEVTFTATVDESRTLTLPAEVPLGEVEVVVRERYPVGSSAALWHAVDNAPKVDDPEFWERARAELFQSREED